MKMIANRRATEEARSQLDPSKVLSLFDTRLPIALTRPLMTLETIQIRTQASRTSPHFSTWGQDWAAQTGQVDVSISGRVRLSKFMHNLQALLIPGVSEREFVLYVQIPLRPELLIHLPRG